MFIHRMKYASVKYVLHRFQRPKSISDHSTLDWNLTIFTFSKTDFGNFEMENIILGTILGTILYISEKYTYQSPFT